MEERGQPGAAGTSGRVNEAGGRGDKHADNERDASYHFDDHLLPQEPPLGGLELWDRGHRVWQPMTNPHPAPRARGPGQGKQRPAPLLMARGGRGEEGGPREDGRRGTEAGGGLTHILHALDVRLDLLQHPGAPLRLLRAPHTLVDALGHLLDVALGVQQQRAVRVVLGGVLQEVLGGTRGRSVCLAAPRGPGGTVGRCDRGLPLLPQPRGPSPRAPGSPHAPGLPCPPSPEARSEGSAAQA